MHLGDGGFEVGSLALGMVWGKVCMCISGHRSVGAVEVFFELGCISSGISGFGLSSFQSHLPV